MYYKTYAFINSKTLRKVHNWNFKNNFFTVELHTFFHQSLLKLSENENYIFEIFFKDLSTMEISKERTNIMKEITLNPI